MMKEISSFEKAEAFKEIYKDIISGLVRTDIPEKNHDRYARVIIGVEILAYCTYMVNDKEKSTNAFRDLFYSPELPAFKLLNQDESFILRNVRRLFGLWNISGNLEYYINEYIKLETPIRWLKIENNEFTFNKIFNRRASKYRKALLQVKAIPTNTYREMERDENDIIQSVSWQDSVTAEKHSVKINICADKLEGQEYTVNSKDKKKLTISLKELKQCCAEMDAVEKELKLRPSMKRNWEKFINELEFLKLTDSGFENSKEIEIMGMAHWVGKTSVGKSTLMRILAYYISKLRQGVVTLIVKDVVEVAEMVNLLNKLGVKAVPYLSHNNRRDHLEQYMNSLEGTSKQNLYFEDTFLKYIDELCPLYYLENAGNVEYKAPPCFHLQEKKKYTVCPFLKKCDYLAMYKELPEAQVIVTTLQSVAYGELPKGMFKEKITVLEYLCKVSDLIMIDEADKCQSISEEIYIPSMDLMKPGIFHRIAQKLMGLFIINPDKLYIHKIFTDWYEQFQQLTLSIQRIYRLVLTDNYCSKKCSASPFSHRNALNWSANLVVKNNRDKSKRIELAEDFKAGFYKIKGNLKYFLSDERKLNEEILKFIREFLDAKNIQKKDEEINKTCNCLAISIYSEVFEDCFKEVSDKFYIIQDIVQKTNVSSSEELLNDISLLTNLENKYKGVIPLAPVVFEVGLQYTIENESLKVHIYSANGRYLLRSLDNLFEADNKINTNVVLLSGTSYLPQSKRYDLGIKPHYLLRRQGQKNVEIKYEVYYPKDKKNKPIQVSGIEEGFKESNLKTSIGFMLQDKIRDEDYFDRLLDESPEDRKRILLLVNSYDQCDYVFNELKSKPGLQGKVFKLINKTNSDSEKGEWPRQKLSSFPMSKGVILIAPVLAMERGHNILNKSGVAAFYTAIYLVRPYPIPYDLLDYAALLNSEAMESYDENINDKDFSVQVKNIKKQAYISRDNFFNSSYAYRHMKPEFRKNLIANVYVSMHQVESRLVRGDVPARVIFTDASFLPILDNGEKNTEETSMLLGMQTLFDEELNFGGVKAQLLEELYGPRIEGLKNLKILY